MDKNNDYVLRSDVRAYVRHAYAKGLNLMEYIDEIPAADVEPSRRWIPVTDPENLPKRSTPCLVACNQWGGETVRKATWLASERIFHENGRDITEYVTHWMDSPRAPGDRK